jgi:dUTP pyrophosphatase
MKRIAKFEKVSLEQFMKDWCDTFELNASDPDTRREIESIYGGIELPKRATKFSAGHDFVSPLTFTLKPNDTIKIPTGIRCGIDTDWVLMIYPRSGLGFKYGINLMNQTAVVDADYYYSNNEGHIFIKLVNRGDKIVTVKRDDKFTQGVFLPYGITEDDNVNDKRNGGLGSTGN